MSAVEFSISFSQNWANDDSYLRRWYSNSSLTPKSFYCFNKPSAPP